MSVTTFGAWRIQFQSDDQALKAAWEKMCEQAASLSRAREQLQAIATAKRSNFEDSVDYQDWAASQAAKTLAEIITPEPTITRSPGLCLGCKTPLGQGHTTDCYFAAFTPRRTA